MKWKTPAACRAASLLMAIIALQTTVAAQSSRVDGGSVTRGTFGFYWETHLEPPIPVLSDGFGTAAEADASGVIHRILLDQSRRAYFGYDVTVEPLASTNTYRLTFGPLTLPSQLRQRFLGDDASRWTMLPPPGFPESRTVRAGEVLQLSLLTNGAWGQTLVDYVSVQEPPQRPITFASVSGAPREFSFSPGPPRDFRTDDVELRLQAPRVSINGRLEDSSKNLMVEATGAVVWLYLPERGRFLLSLQPQPKLGFQRAGEVRGSVLRFTVGGETVSVVSGSRIAPGQAAFNLYVLHDPTWRPTYAHASLSVVIVGSADRAEYVAGK